MRKIALLSAVLFAAFAPGGAARAAETPNPVTVNDYTPAQLDRAMAAARRDGFTAARVTMAQAGDLFLRADKGGMEYFLTVTPEGKVYPSTPVPMSSVAG